MEIGFILFWYFPYWALRVFFPQKNLYNCKILFGRLPVPGDSCMRRESLCEILYDLVYDLIAYDLREQVFRSVFNYGYK